MTDTPIRVLIADDHDIVRSGLSMFLQTRADMELVGQAADGIEAITLCQNLLPDVILMDIEMPNLDGIEATAYIREHFPRIPVIILTSYKDKDSIQAALKAGATSYILKNVSIDELAASIHAAMQGRPTLSPEVTRTLISSVAAPSAPDNLLTPRELEVLARMVIGESNAQIADALNLSRNTVKFHVSVILSKLGASSRTEAAMIAIQRGIVKK